MTRCLHCVQVPWVEEEVTIKCSLDKLTSLFISFTAEVHADTPGNLQNKKEMGKYNYVKRKVEGERKRAH